MKIKFMLENQCRGKAVYRFTAGIGQVLYHKGTFGEAKKRATRWANELGVRSLLTENLGRI